MKTYTLNEANGILPQVRRLAGQLVELASLLPDLHDQARIAEYQARRPGSGAEDAARLERSRDGVTSAETDLAQALKSLEDLGVHVKDIRTGLVDFPAYREGELVELCWRLGEESVLHWHRIGEGFPGRKRL